MGLKDKVQDLAKKLKMDSHHLMERFGVTMGSFGVIGAILLTGSGAAAFDANRAKVSDTALYTPAFTTSKTSQAGSVEGIFTNELGNKALVLMKFTTPDGMPLAAANYEAFLMGSTPKLGVENLKTEGIEGDFHVFGQTGYVGVLLDAAMPFEKQILNLTMRSTQDLAVSEEGPIGDTIGSDASFSEFDQWRVYFNPGAKEAKHLDALDEVQFDPAQAYYDVVLESEEDAARMELETKLLQMRSNLTQIDSYTANLATTMTPDGQFLRPPAVPEQIADDKIVGQTAAEAGVELPSAAAAAQDEDAAVQPGLSTEQVDASTLALETDDVVPGGYNFDWRSGDVYQGYLKDLVPADESMGSWLTAKNAESADNDKTATSQIAAMKWMLSDGTDLKQDYESSDRMVQPLRKVMNNLSQAYQDYANNKEMYQTTLRAPLLELDVELRDVQANSSVAEDDEFMSRLHK